MSSMITLSEKIEIPVNQMRQRRENQETRIMVGMGTCGIAAGAEEVFQTLAEELDDWGIEDAQLVKTGCMGLCKWEPMVEVIKPGKGKTTYVHVTPEKARRIVEEHIIEGKVVKEFCPGDGKQETTA